MTNLKNRAIISTNYFGELVISEVVNLNQMDNDFSAMTIKTLKCKNDRYLLILGELLLLLREYFKAYKPLQDFMDLARKD